LANVFSLCLLLLCEIYSSASHCCFNWTPVHASIKGSEIADQLAKEAAKEAEALELTTQVFTKQDIRKTARDVVTKKWARRVPPPPGSAPAIETDHYSFLFEIIYLIFNFIY
jgi:hypothetical protein